jgi:Tfp pilus assembly protein PilF
MAAVSVPRLSAVAAVILIGFTVRGEGAPPFLTSRPRPTPKAARPLDVGGEVRTAAGQRRRLALGDGVILYVNENTTLKRTGERGLDVTTGEVFLDAAGRSDAAPLVVQTPRREIKATAGRLDVSVGGDGTGVLVTAGKALISDLEKPLTSGQQLAPRADRPQAAGRVSHPLEWARDLMAQADTPLVPTSSHAGGDLVAHDPDGQEARLALRKYHVDVHIEDGFARTTIDQTYFNHTNSRLEGTFYFPLPPDASLSRLAMYVDGTRREGGMVERDYGRQVYERIVYQQKDPALLEWLDGSTFKMRVFPLEPRQEKRLLLSYTQKLPALYGQLSYRFPAGHSLDAVQEFSAHVRVKGGAKFAWASPSHTFRAATDGGDLVLDAAQKDARINRDVVLTLTEERPPEVRFSSAEQDGAKYLMLRYRPELPSVKERQRRDWIFLFEASGDRDPLLARTQIEIIRGVLAQADPEDTFQVLTANTRVFRLRENPIPVTTDRVQDAIAFLEQAHLIGALDLGQALSTEALVRGKPANPWLVHVGSGIAAMGERRDAELVKRLPAGTHYVGVGVGKRWNRSFMKLAAERTGGYFTQINPDEQVSWRAFELAATLDTPRLLDLRVEDRDGKVRFLPFARSLAQGEELAAAARLGADEKAPEAVVVSGTVNGEAFRQELAVKDVAVKADYLPRTWAKLEIERLLAEDPIKHKDAVVALSKAMYVMTPFTSLLVLENEEMYQQYKVDRGRKDHWAIYPCPEKIDVVYEPEDGSPGDPKKGIKPSARQVLKTVLVRQLARQRTIREAKHMRELSRSSFAGGLVLRRRQLEPELVSGNFSAQGRDLTGLPGSIILSKVPAGRPKDWNPQFDPVTGQPLRALDEAEQSNNWLDYYPPSQALDEVPAKSKVADAAPALWRNGEDEGVVLHAGTYSLDHRAVVLRGFTVTKKAPEPTVMNLEGAPDDTSDAPLLYQRPVYSGDDQPYFDLVAYAPGLSTSAADVREVLEAEAAPSAANKPGVIDDGARVLFTRARAAGWRSFTLAGEGDGSALRVIFDGTGRFTWERRLTFGLREQVVCDGTTLVHAYPDLGLAARRSISRFHRLDFARRIPWALPQPEDLARGADLRVVKGFTVALVPHGAGAKDADGKPLPYLQMQYTFAEDGGLAERRLLEMPAQKTLRRETYTPQGTIKVFGEDGKEITTLSGVLDSAKAPNLRPRLDGLMVLPLPYRSPEHVRAALGIEGKNPEQLRFEDGLALLAAEFAAGNGDNAANIFRRCFHGRDQRQIGFYVLLAACGQNLDSEHLDVLGEHTDEPLAQYLALHSSAVLRKHASQWAAASNPWGEGFLHHLALSHALGQRWQKGRSIAGRSADLDRALAFVHSHKNSAFGWAVLGLLADRAADDEAAGKDTRAVHKALAEAWLLFADSPGLSYAARYEHARSLLKSAQKVQASKAFVDLYEQTIKDGVLPPLDGDLRAALLGEGAEADLWGSLLRRTAAQLVKDKKSLAVLTMARQCWEIGDQPQAGALYAMALDEAPRGKERQPLRTAALAYLWQTGQLAQADRLLQEVLADAEPAEKPALWRLAAQLASRRDQPARELECLEQALDAEFAHLPDVVNVQSVRSDYERLLKDYQAQAEALVALRLQVPADFRDKVVRTADRWRALDRDGSTACQMAARVLQTLGERELTWDYLTTPVALRPNESEPWANLGQTLARQGEVTLADRAYAAAFEAEPTNAQLLWDRAQNLAQAGQVEEARKLYRRLAEGSWQPRFSGLQSQARWQLDKR